MSTSYLMNRGKTMQRVRLRAIIYEVDFRFSEVSIWDAYRRSKAFAGELEKNEVYAFVNGPRTMILWVRRCDEHVLRTEKWRRLDGLTHQWEDRMIADYARESGYELVGLRTFAEHLEEAKRRREEGVFKRPAWQKAAA